MFFILPLGEMERSINLNEGLLIVTIVTIFNSKIYNNYIRKCQFTKENDIQ